LLSAFAQGIRVRQVRKITIEFIFKSFMATAPL